MNEHFRIPGNLPGNAQIMDSPDERLGSLHFRETDYTSK
jgi:hypothetical protein